MIVLLITDFLVSVIFSGKMSEGRSFLGSAEVGGRVFMIGGCLNEDYSTTEVWDPDTGTFQYIAKEPTSLIQRHK